MYSYSGSRHLSQTMGNQLKTRLDQIPLSQISQQVRSTQHGSFELSICRTRTKATAKYEQFRNFFHLHERAANIESNSSVYDLCLRQIVRAYILRYEKIRFIRISRKRSRVASVSVVGFLYYTKLQHAAYLSVVFPPCIRRRDV